MAVNKIYEMNCDFESTSIDSKSFVSQKLFRKGQQVSGDFYYKTQILVDNKFPIPLEYLSESNSVKIDRKLDEGRVDDLKEGILFSPKKIKEGGSKNYIHGAILGGGSALLVAMYFNKSKLWMTLGGALVGVYITSILSNKK